MNDSASREGARRILVVDDDKDARTIASEVVSILGFEVVQAADGESALKTLCSEPIDIVILDYMLPGLSGPEVCQQLKADSVGALTPVIMVTARTDVKDKVFALQSGGADDYLTKPYHFEELQARVQAWLRVRDLNLRLIDKNRELQAVQTQLLRKERELVAFQLAGAAAHRLGQPLSAILLNCHLLETVPPNDARFQRALNGVRNDVQRISKMIEELKSVDTEDTEVYHGDLSILRTKPGTE